MPEHDIVIVGGGCVGCSIAVHLARLSDLDVAVVEKEYSLALHQSGRNSGVLHPGFNYRPGSLKTRFATAGTSRMKEYCRTNDLPLYECGVIVVARTPEEEERLTGLRSQAAEMGVGEGYRIVPFSGEYYELVPHRRDLENSMIYPTPDPDLPFLGVHYTRRMDGSVIVGPNAVLAFGREAYRNTDIDLGELAETLGYREFRRLLADRDMISLAWEELNKSYRKDRFVAAAQRLVPRAAAVDFTRSYAGVRAQLVSADGELMLDPLVREGDRSMHVLNAVSPGLTSSLPFGEHLAHESLSALDR